MITSLYPVLMSEDVHQSALNSLLIISNFRKPSVRIGILV